MLDYVTTRPVIAASSMVYRRPKDGTGTTETGSSANILYKSKEGLAVMDENSLAVTVIVKGKEVPGTIINGGSKVNVISIRTCDKLGIQEWEPCPFWLQMTNTSSVRLTRLIRNLEITIGGHAFRISD